MLTFWNINLKISISQQVFPSNPEISKSLSFVVHAISAMLNSYCFLLVAVCGMWDVCWLCMLLELLMTVFVTDGGFNLVSRRKSCYTCFAINCQKPVSYYSNVMFNIHIRQYYIIVYVLLLSCLFTVYYLHVKSTRLIC